jgi:mannose-6-phosphate isomerase-like protein (cupin superfamily)
MKKLFLIPAALLLMLPALAEAPKDFKMWKSAELKAWGAKLAPKINAQKFATETPATLHGNVVLMVHREGTGEAEFHENADDFTIVQSGSASVIIGGTMKDPRTTGPGEIRSATIEGGETYKIEAGDVFNIPSKTPHQVVVPAGGQVTYMCLKVPAGK